MKKNKTAKFYSALITAIAIFVACFSFSALGVGNSKVYAMTSTSTPTGSGTKLTSSHVSATLTTGDYYLEEGETLTLRANSGRSALIVDGVVTIYIPSGATLSVYGGAASSTTGAGAGIEVSTGNTLKIVGEGTLNAYGGNGANGGNGAGGESASWGDDSYSYIPDSGYGGNGGGGAGAGIGTKGGKGGDRTSWRSGFYGGYQWTDNFLENNYSGSPGYTGNAGASALSCGEIYIAEQTTVIADGGNAGTRGGSGGSMGSRDYESDEYDIRGLAGGAGGGGGGAGKAGADIGTGGGGGGSGGSGGAIGYAWSCYFVGGGGGGGGAGAVGGGCGSWSHDGEIPDQDCDKYFGGKTASSTSGGVGGKDAGGAGGQGCQVRIRSRKSTSASWSYPTAGSGGKGGSSGANCVAVTPTLLYVVGINNGASVDTYYASTSGDLPSSVPVQSLKGHTFEGYSNGGVKYYDEKGTLISSIDVNSDITLTADFSANSYNYQVEPQAGSSSSSVCGQTDYNGVGITLQTPEREGYLFRGWKITSSSSTINDEAHYTYTPAVSRFSFRRSGQTEAEFIYNEDKTEAQTAGFEKIGDSVTLYNLAVNEGDTVSISEIWVENRFDVAFNDFDGDSIVQLTGEYGESFEVPSIPTNVSDYYTYTFKYWKCDLDGAYYETDEIDTVFGTYLAQESVYGEKVYDVTFTAVYDVVCKKEFELVGSLGNNNLDMSQSEFPNGVLVLSEDSTDVEVITNFKITKNDGVAVVLLIPEYDKDAFTIKSASINGVDVYSTGATSNAVLEGFTVTATGNQASSDDLFKILIDNEIANNTTSDEIFIQIVYTMKEAIGGLYEFGFITAEPPMDTDSITHGDRSEAYGVYDPNVSVEDVWSFNELQISVDSTAINVVIKADGKIEIENNQEFIYNAQAITAQEITENIARALQFTYNGYAKKANDTLVVKWYDVNGNEISAPTDAGSYKVTISANETTYYFAAPEVEAYFTILPYEISVNVGNQSFEYTGNNIVIDESASNATITTADGIIPSFLANEITISKVMLDGSYVTVGDYIDVIKGIVEFIGNGKEGNYTITYNSGDLTITKAFNEWIEEITAPDEDYSGNGYSSLTYSSKYGDAIVEYSFETDKDTGDPIWTTGVPTDAGTYLVRVTVNETENYTGLQSQATFVINQKVLDVSGFDFIVDEKTYNGESQVWQLDPNDDGNLSDAQIKMTITDANMVNYVKLAGVVRSETEDYVNVGTPTIFAVLEITNSNYTFVNYNGDKVSSITHEVVAKINPCPIYVHAMDQSAIYTGNEPAVGSGVDYIANVTLEDGTKPNFIITDFLSGNIEVYTIANFYDANETYYVATINGENITYTQQAVTQAQFEANQQIGVGNEGYVEYYVKTIKEPEQINLSKEPGVNAGVYTLYATLGANSNYVLISEVCQSGVFTIRKQGVEVPTFEALIYNSQEQTPVVPTGYEGIYEFVFEEVNHINVGTYVVTVKLIDKNNYEWLNVYEGETTDDISLDWEIAKKVLNVRLPDAESSYEYGTHSNDIVWVGGPEWIDQPFAGDENTGLSDFLFGFDTEYLQTGNHNAVINQENFNSNYTLVPQGGLVTIVKKVLIQHDLTNGVVADVKYYTGNTLVLETTDFTLSLLDPYETYSVFDIVSVDTKNHVDANGYMNGENFAYYEEDGKIYVSVTVALNDTDNYELADGASLTFDIEAYIAKAQNAWETSPAVNAQFSDITTSAQARFGDYVVTFYDENGNEVNISDIGFDQTYTAKFVVLKTNNYDGLESSVNFNRAYNVITIPNVYLDANLAENKYDGTTKTIVYDGDGHSLVVDINAGYTTTPSDAMPWKNVGDYFLTIVLADGYMWDNNTTDDLVYTLEITKKDLTLTADNLSIVFGSEVPEYTVTASGFVNGETFDAIAPGDAISNYIACEYAKGNNVGEYTIEFTAESKTLLNDILSNYETTYANGILTVTQLEFSYDDITTPNPDNAGGSISIPDVVISGLTYVYNNTEREVTVNGVAEELIPVINYYQNDELLSSAPVNAGEYRVEIALTLKNEYNNANYLVPAPKNITLTITPAQIKITIQNQEFTYTGEDLSGGVATDVAQAVVTYEDGSAFDINDGCNVTSIILAVGPYVDAKVYENVISCTHTFNTANYVVTTELGDVIVNRATNSWLIDLWVADGLVYDKEQIEVGADKDYFADGTFGEVIYSFYIYSNDQYVKFDGIPTEAGTYYVKADIVETANFTGLTTPHYVEFTIAKVQIDVAAITFESKEVYYNTRAHSIFAEEDSEIYYATYFGNEVTNVGGHEVTAEFTLVDPDNYEFKDGENSKVAYITIKKAEITITAQNNSSAYGEDIKSLSIDAEVINGEVDYLSDYIIELGVIDLETTATKTSNVGKYPITWNFENNFTNIDVTFVAGEYEITKYLDNEVVVTAEDVYYLMELDITAVANRGNAELTYSDSPTGEFTSIEPTNAGTYYVKATVAETDNYNGCEAVKSFTINKAKLKSVASEDIVYNLDTITWTAVTQTVNGNNVGCKVTYLVGDVACATTTFTATQTGSFTLTAVPFDTSNYEVSDATSLLPVYSISFVDSVDSHERQQNLADLNADAYNVQYRFENQGVTHPQSIDSAAIPAIEGYTFNVWTYNGDEYAFNSGVHENMVLYTSWTINEYTITYYNEVVSDSKVENGVYVPGTITEIVFQIDTYKYGDVFAGITITPTKEPDEVYTYEFSHWSHSRGGMQAIFPVKVVESLEFYAVYNATAGSFTITYKVSVDNAEYVEWREETLQYNSSIVFTLENVSWFRAYGWYLDEDRTIPAQNVQAGDMTVYGAYVYDIGAGDVNADGVITADDITLYRQYTVGGYGVIRVESGDEWELINSTSYDSNARYFFERVQDVNKDVSGDIRDITTIRMAIAGGYGYVIVNGLDSSVGVSGQGIALVYDEIPVYNAGTLDELKTAIENGGVIELTADITLDNSVIQVLNDTVINLNGYDLNTSEVERRSFEMASNSSLVINATTETITTGNYGLVYIPDGVDNVTVTLNGGNYVANTDNGSFIKPKGEGKIDVRLNNVNLTDTSSKNSLIDCSSYGGDQLNVDINGGEYNTYNGIVGNANVNVSNATINVKQVGVEMSDKGVCEIDNSTITVESISPNNDGTSACVMASYGGQVVVSNSTLTSNTYVASIGYNQGVYPTITISDSMLENSGTFADMYKFLGEGTIIVDGVSQVNDINSLSYAFDNGGNVVLLNDIDVAEGGFTLPNGKTMVLNLNGKTISQKATCSQSYQIFIQNNGTMTICDNVGTGKISFTDESAGDSEYGWGAYTLKNVGTLTVESGKIENLSTQEKHMYCAIHQSGGTTTINGGVISTPNYRSVRINHGNLIINGGTFEGRVWMHAFSNLSLEVNGGEFTPSERESSPTSIYINNQTYVIQTSITGGCFNAKIGCDNADNLAGVITGGMFTESAKNNTDAALLANGYEFNDNGDGTYTVVITSSQD